MTTMELVRELTAHVKSLINTEKENEILQLKVEETEKELDFWKDHADKMAEVYEKNDKELRGELKYWNDKYDELNTSLSTERSKELEEKIKELTKLRDHYAKQMDEGIEENIENERTLFGAQARSRELEREVQRLRNLVSENATLREFWRERTEKLQNKNIRLENEVSWLTKVSSSNMLKIQKIERLVDEWTKNSESK